MSLKAIPLQAEQSATKAADKLSALERLDNVESSLLNLLQEIKSIRNHIQKQVSKSGGLEPLLEAEDVAKILGLDIGYVYQQARAAKIPSVKLGKYRKFSPSQIKKWLDRKNNS
jgi:excisionase family DNA binding protein